MFFEHDVIGVISPISISVFWYYYLYCFGDFIFLPLLLLQPMLSSSSPGFVRPSPSRGSASASMFLLLVNNSF